MDTNNEVTAEQIKELLDSGMTQTAAAEELNITVGVLKGIMKKAKDAEGVKPITTGTAVAEITDNVPASVFAETYAGEGVTDKANITVLTATEYDKYSQANGRYFGRERGQKTKCTIEELRALINSGWKPSMVMRKHGINEEEFQQLVWKLSKAELRDRPLKFSIEQDFIEKG